MLINLKSGAEFYLDGLVVETILSHFSARDLALLCSVCQTLRAPVQLAAQRTLVGLVRRLQGSLLRHCERGSWITQLRQWELLEQSNRVWLQANKTAVTLVKQGEGSFVKRATDLSGHGFMTAPHGRMPAFRADAVNGHPCFDFDGASVLKTQPFAQPLPQPITIMVVARARGDTTIIDSLGPSSGRFELCHGYPSGWHPSPEITITASGQDASPRHSLRGSTRGTGDWHVYTAIFDHRRSEIFVDGYCEASGKTAGGNGLDGLSIGCDHNGVFYLTGSLSELRLFHCHMATPQRVQIEAALAHRYGISYSSAPSPTPSPSKSRSRFSCAPRAAARTAESY